MGNYTQRTIKITEYSKVPQTLTRTPTGTGYALLDTVLATLDLNPKVVDTLVNVSAYTELNTQQKVYDWFQYYGTTNAGIHYAYDLDIQSNVLVSTGNKAITFVTTGDVGVYDGSTYTINASTISGQKILTGGVITLGTTTPVYPILFTGSAGTSNWLKITLTANQYALIDNTTHVSSNYQAFIGMGDVTTRTIKLVEYSKVPQTLTRTPAGVLLDTVSATLDLNPKVVANLVTVSGYTSLDTQQKVYDWFQYYGTTTDGIHFAYDLDIQSDVLVSTGNKNIIFQTTGDVGTYNNTTYTIKATTISGIKISTGGSITLTGTTAVYPLLFQSSTGTSNWLKITLTSGQVALIDGSTYVTSSQ